MVEGATGDLVRALWEAIEWRNWDGVAALLADDFVLEWPQSGEVIRGPGKFVAVNAAYPGEWHITVERVTDSGSSALSRRFASSSRTAWTTRSRCSRSATRGSRASASGARSVSGRRVAPPVGRAADALITVRAQTVARRRAKCRRTAPSVRGEQRVDVEGRPVEAVLEGGAAAGRRNEWERLPEQIVASGSLYSRTDESTGDGAAIYREATLPADGASHESA